MQSNLTWNVRSCRRRHCDLSKRRTPLTQQHSVTSYKTTAMRTWNAYLTFVALLERRFAAARLLRLWVRIPSGAWMPVSCECFVVVVRKRSLWRAYHSSKGVLPTVVHRWVWSRKTSWIRSSWPTGGLTRQKQSSIRVVPITCVL